MNNTDLNPWEEEFKRYFDELPFVGFPPSFEQALMFARKGRDSVQAELTELRKEREWINIEVKLPDTDHETEEWDDSGDNCIFHGMVSNTLELSDGQKLARGHYRDDGVFVIYGAEHDFQIMEGKEVKYWKKITKAPFFCKDNIEPSANKDKDND